MARLRSHGLPGRYRVTVISYDPCVVSSPTWCGALSANGGAVQGAAVECAGRHPSLPTQSARQDHEAALMGELDYLREWEQGHIPFLGAVVRVRQIRRASLA